MTVTVNGETYYRTTEICQIAGISKNTFFRWVRERSFADVQNRDRRGWRLFTGADINRLKTEVNRINKQSDSKSEEDSLGSSY
jgi:phage antirepressor YoqD-like protein